MKVTFLGTGEAFDRERLNTSILLENRGCHIMLDCGFSAPWALWKHTDDPNLLDAVYLSHWHGDHSFGIPALLVRMWEDQRRKKLTIISQRGIKDFILRTLTLAYPGFQDKFQFPIEFISVSTELSFMGLQLRFAEGEHSQKNLAISATDPETGKTAGYSGDGLFTEKTRALYKNTDLCIHEAYKVDQEIIGHGSVKGCLDMAKECNVKQLALLHINRDILAHERDKMDSMIQESGVNTIVPVPGDSITL